LEFIINSKFPIGTDLSAEVHFEPEQGKIWLDEQRVILNTVPALATIWHEIVRSLGIERARSVFMRSGFKNGQVDAELARKHRPNTSSPDLFLAGPQLHMLRGMVTVRPEVLEIDAERKHFRMEHVWVDSYEVDIALGEMGVVDLPVCWGLLGYACGFSSTIMGFDILFKEITCRGKGDDMCRVIGKPAAEWEDAEDFEIFTKSEYLIEVLYDLQTKIAARSDDEGERQVFSKLVGKSQIFKQMCSLANKVASSKASVLLTGETGVGKEMVAQEIHNQSDRAGQPFIAINCAAIPQELIEAELFGVEKGAYTGATHSRQGRFERAHRGTIFLDEVIELSPRAQASLLRVLQEREFDRVGGTQVVQVDVRLIAATNEKLEDAVKQGKFRADLYYRLNVFPLEIPPLRERHDDIPLLAEFFIEKYESLYAKKTLGLTDRALSHLLNYQWPGNIRELENVIERGVILTEKGQSISLNSLYGGTPETTMLHRQDTPIDGLTTDKPGAGKAAAATSWPEAIFENAIPMDEVESILVCRAMELSNDNVSKAARLLGMSRPAFAYRLAKLKPE
jgi:DNA-binding NtrC family response regulator